MDNNTKEFHANPSITNGKQPIATRDYFKCTSSIQEAGSFYGSHSTGQNTGHSAPDKYQRCLLALIHIQHVVLDREEITWFT